MKIEAYEEIADEGVGQDFGTEEKRTKFGGEYPVLAVEAADFCDGDIDRC